MDRSEVCDSRRVIDLDCTPVLDEDSLYGWLEAAGPRTGLEVYVRFSLRLKVSKVRVQKLVFGDHRGIGTRD